MLTRPRLRPLLHRLGLLHICRPPHGTIGLLWACPGCRSEFLWRPVESRELGRVINMWVRQP